MFRIEALSDRHHRKGFASASEPLSRYLHTQVSQDVRRRITTCWVAVSAEWSVERSAERQAGELAPVLAYYTLAASSVLLTDLPAETTKKLPRYPSVPVARVGRLAVHQRLAGQRLGSALVWDARQRAMSSALAAFAMVVDAKDEVAAAFYRHLGFQAFGQRPLQLFLELPKPG